MFQLFITAKEYSRYLKGTCPAFLWFQAWLQCQNSNTAGQTIDIWNISCLNACFAPFNIAYETYYPLIRKICL